MAIDELGFSLLGRAEDQRKRRQRSSDKAAKYALIGSLAQLGIGFVNKNLEKKAQQWQQDEEILASKRNYKRAYDSGVETLNEWDTASNFAGGVAGYLGNQIRPEVERRIKMNIDEDALMDPDAFDRLVDKQVKELVGGRDGDGIYGNFYKARNAALDLTPDSDYNAFIEAKNPAYKNTLDLIVGKVTKDVPDRQAYVSNVISSRYATNAQAYNAALDAYQKGLSGVTAVKLGDAVKKKLEFKPDEQIIKTEPFTKDVDGLPVTVKKITTKNRVTGEETITYEAEKGDERGEAFVNNELTKTETIKVTNPYTFVETEQLVAVGVGGAIIKSTPIKMSATFGPPPAIGDVDQKAADRIKPNFLQAFLTKPDGQQKLDEFTKLITLGEEGVTQTAFDNILKATHLTSMAIQDKLFGGENVQPPLRASQSFKIDSEKVSMDLAAEIMTLQQEYSNDADTKGVGLIQNVMSEVVGEKGNIRGPLVLFGLDRLNRRSQGTYDLSGTFTKSEFEDLARATVSIPEMERYDLRTVEEKKYLKEIIVKSIEDGVQADGTNTSVFMIPFRKGGAPIATLFGVDPIKPEPEIKVPKEYTGPFIGDKSVGIQKPKEEKEELSGGGPDVQELFKRKEYLERRTSNRVAGQRLDEVDELKNVNRQLAMLGQNTAPIYLSRSNRRKLNSSLTGLFDATQQLKRQPAGAAQQSTKVKRLEEDIDEFSSTLQAIDTRASYVADRIKNLRGFKNLEQEDIEQTLFKAYNDKDFVDQVIVALYL